MSSEHLDAPGRPKSEPLIIAFADSSYLPLLQLWVGRVRELGVRRLKVFCLDSVTLEWCKAQSISCASMQWTGKLRDLWVRRIEVFSALLAAGEEFIHSDIDAIWIQNPLRAGSAVGSDDDLLFSQGTIWPPDVHDQWGFVLCCGWFWAKPTEAARRFFQVLEAEVRHSGDDQVSVNRLLATMQARWSHGGRGEYQIALGDRHVQCWSHLVRAQAGSLSVALLPQREFQRLPEVSAQAVVRHYLTPKNCEQKLIAFRTWGLI